MKRLMKKLTNLVPVVVGLAVVLIILPRAASAQLPEGVTEEMVTLGEELYSGNDTSCKACHGADVKGVPGMTKDLTNGEWVSIDGGFESLVAAIKDGIGADKTGSMPMPAARELGEDQARALAAYIWKLNNAESQ